MSFKHPFFAETINSFTRCPGMLFHSEVPDKISQGHGLPSCLNLEEEVEEIVGEEHKVVVTSDQSSGGPLLSCQPSQNAASMAEHATLLSTPVLPVECVGSSSSSPFLLLEDAQTEEVYLDMDDLTVEEAEEAKESPLHKRLSMSLITYHEGVPPGQIYTEVQVHDNPASPPANTGAPTGEECDHSYTVPSISVYAECPSSPAHVSTAEVAADEAPVTPTSPERPEEAAQASLDIPQCNAATDTLALPVKSSPTVSQEQPPRPSTGIQCPTFDPRSPSQVVFKPQWLGKGFGTAGLRARGGRASRGGSSPLAVRVAVKNVNNENKGQSSKTKQKGVYPRHDFCSYFYFRLKLMESKVPVIKVPFSVAVFNSD